MAVTAKDLNRGRWMSSPNCLVDCPESVFTVVSSSWVVPNQQEKINWLRVIYCIKESLLFDKVRSCGDL